MKPKKLSMTAFGPYAEKTVIDFTKLQANGMFLITGETGAGKTSIFDAISYALYGKASGDMRDRNNFHSDYAAENTPTEVELSFTHGKKNYTIRRTIKFSKSRTDGSLTPKPSVCLQIEGEEPIEKENAVSEKMQEILRISYDQFKQLSMIAQGEFQKLLCPSSLPEREEILRKLFNTEGYQRLTEILADLCREAREKLSRTESGMKNRLETVLYRDDAAQKEALQALLEETDAREHFSETRAEQAIRLLTELIEEDTALQQAGEQEADRKRHALDERKRQLGRQQADNEALRKLQELKAEAEELKKQQPDIEKKEKYHEGCICALQTLQPVYKEYLRQKRERENAASAYRQSMASKELSQSQKAKANDLHQQALSKKPLAEAKKKESTELKSKEAAYEKSDSFKAEIKRLSKAQADAKKFIQELQDRQKTLSDTLKKNEAEAESLKALTALLNEKIARHEALQKDYRKINDHILRYDSSKNQEKSLKEQKKEVQQAQAEALEKGKEFKRAEEKYQKILTSIICNQAGLLADKLEENQPCPVCGSLHHPKPAKLTEKHYTDDDLKRAKKDRDQKEKIARDMSASVEAQRGGLEEACRSFVTDAQSLIAESNENWQVSTTAATGTPEECILALKDIQDKIKPLGLDAREERTKIEEKCTRLKALEKSITAAKTNLEETQKKLTEEQFSLTDISSRLASAEGGLQELPKLDFPSKAEAVAHQEKLDADALAIEAAIEETRAALQKAEAALAAAQKDSELKQAEAKRLQESESLAQKAWEALLKEKDFSEEDYQKHLISEENLHRLEEEIEDYRQRATANSARLSDAEKNAKGKVQTDTESLKESIQKEEASLSALQKGQSGIDHRIKNNAAIVQSLKEASRQAEKERAQLSRTELLSDMARGQLAGKRGLGTLEQYVQGYGFDRILAAANRRLSIMSDGLYELYRHRTEENKGGGKKSAALSIDVLDTNTGKRRPANTLSGGEMFKASLSLALGMSDTISSMHGGIQMDALFIDEGFGTLDQKSLADALEVLTGLTDASRMIGIISHRDELKTCIPQKLIVKKAKNGSTVVMDTGI